MCVSGRFAGEVASINLLESSINVVKVEYLARDDPVVGVDLDDAEHLGADLAGHAAVDGTDVGEGKVLPAGRNDARRYGLCADLDGCLVVRDVHISATSNPCVHDTTAIVHDNVVGQ